MIDFIEKLDTLKEYMNYWIDYSDLRWKCTYMIGRELNGLISYKFPLNHFEVGHDDFIEIVDIYSIGKKRDGCGRPDKIEGDIEFRYLWKGFKPISFSDFIKKNK